MHEHSNERFDSRRNIKFPNIFLDIPMLLMVQVGDKLLKSDSWFLDSGCNNHLCNRKEYFVDFNAQFFDNVNLGNDTSSVVKGKGNV